MEFNSISKLSDKNFINYLYNTFFKRNEYENEQMYWLQAIKEGITREEIYCIFLNSKEFRNMYKLDMEM